MLVSSIGIGKKSLVERVIGVAAHFPWHSILAIDQAALSYLCSSERTHSQLPGKPPPNAGPSDKCDRRRQGRVLSRPIPQRPHQIHRERPRTPPLFSQLSVVFPEHDAVLAVFAAIDDSDAMRNSGDVGPRFQRMSVQYFTACRPGISGHVGPPFHGMSVQFVR
jgi:hypothetical protein